MRCVPLTMSAAVLCLVLLITLGDRTQGHHGGRHRLGWRWGRGHRLGHGNALRLGLWGARGPGHGHGRRHGHDNRQRDRGDWREESIVRSDEVTPTDAAAILETENAANVSMQEGQESGSAVLFDAGRTGRILIRSHMFRQNHAKNCLHQGPKRYRTADGTCNNIFNQGSANTPLKRLLPPEYGDSRNSPRFRGVDGGRLPSPGVVSWLIMEPTFCSMGRTPMFMQFGQFIDHEVTLTPVPIKDGEAIRCCGAGKVYPPRRRHPACLPMRLAASDTRFHGNCMEFVRSLPARTPSGRLIIPREQLNEITSFIDGSAIYGSSRELQEELRETNEFGQPGARMRTCENNLLPPNPIPDCIRREGEECFLAGDERVNVQPGLIAMHVMWVRLHNLIVDALRPRRPGDSDEQLFQKTRKIVIAILQKVHYKEWLPFVIGHRIHAQYRLYPDIRYGKRIGYSVFLHPQVTNAFATAAFRFGHSLLPPHLLVSGTEHKYRDMFFRPDLIYDDYDGVVQALLNTDPRYRAQKPDRFIVKELSAHLFEPANQEKDAPSEGLDLIALNIQRGRDHGLPPFNKFRKLCGIPPVTNFTEFGPVAEKLARLYRSVEDLDLFVGGLLEKPELRGLVGPTFACIMAMQFHALKYGDRYYFETDRMPEGFPDDQLQAIRNVTFAHVVCLTANINSTLQNVFLATGETVYCNDLKNDFLNYTLWQNP